MSSPDGPRSNRTIFRKSPLQEMKAVQGGAHNTDAPARSTNVPLLAAGMDIPSPVPAVSRNPLIMAGLPLLALLASVRGGRAQMALSDLHGIVNAEIVRFGEAMRGLCSDEHLKRAGYALCATADDIVLNMPGHESDVAEWARRSMTVRQFGEAVGGDRFWVLLDQMIARPAGFHNVLELYHACLACGFMGRFRISPNGKAEHEETMQRAYAVLEHPRELSSKELSPHWRGLLTQLSTTRLWTPLAAGAASAIALLLLVYCGLLYLLNQSDALPMATLNKIDAQQPLQLARAAPVLLPATESTKLQRIRKYLAPEIANGAIQVGEDASTIRMRVKSSALFDVLSADLSLNAQLPLLRIADSIAHERGTVMVEGHSDNTRVSGSDLLYHDNMALSQARAQKVADLIRTHVSDPGRVQARGFGDGRPIASNASAEGRARNRRVEVTISRADR